MTSLRTKPRCTPTRVSNSTPLPLTPSSPYECDICCRMHDAGRSFADWVSSEISTCQLHATANPWHRNSVGNNCDVAATGNSGCGVQATSANSYGPGFNSAGGGFYAMERTSSFIKVWFWSRTAGNIPSDVLNGAASVNTDNWVSIHVLFLTLSVNVSGSTGGFDMLG